MVSHWEELWYAFVTKPRHEKKVKSYLETAGFDHYLPLRKTLNQWKDRKRWVEAPLFPGYIFCRVPFVHRFEVLKAPGMVRIVGFNNQPMPVRETEIETIRSLLKSGVDLQVRDGIVVGDYVRISSGILMGLEGRIVEERGAHYFVITIEAVGKSILVDTRSIELKKIA
ncbi:MAG: UpxY family transcription antiterminator [candidate division KSB1 bacterium]|nr:UpxY family transcription antiterminator [candidate division KSB1 bacterium]